ncbi:putative toxin-antitoxin system toxin component, PIN family [Aquibium oceanicum]|uniref:Putative toxin-antitoxin system toxin component, PIN family n=1 Tax=Aquibium oceanicum TaxID=1670800 RepID=A0A1L3SUB8_9HYPH|nr:putative toxin-antitoxin system toxin component, PIN family [Aquibium oceanicum]APH72902.1 putative toxin-antitoxin system toxin component, PIN family [Aquibium oceanicum]
MDVVLDTSVFVSALRSQGGASREVIRRALLGLIRPLFGNALWLEYEDVLGRDIWTEETTSEERRQVLMALAHSGRWVTIHFGWRPNLPDEKDNHLIELAIAGRASAIVTHNVRDVTRGELIFRQLRIMTPREFLEQLT